MAKFALPLVACLLFLSVNVFGVQPKGALELGARVGLFDNFHNEIEQSGSNLRLSVNKNPFYFEGFLNYYLTDFMAVALNAGIYSKGDIQLDVYNADDSLVGSFIGQASVYPIQLGLKLSPFHSQLPLNCHPYLEGGGALIVGREAVTFGTYGLTFAANTDGSIGSETDFNWWGAVGCEIPLSQTLQFDFMVKYIGAKFSGDIAGIRDFSGVQISVGIGYIKLPRR